MASLPLQMVLVFDKSVLSWAFFLCTLLFAFYKVFYYNLPQKTIEIEVFLLILLHTCNQIRLYIGCKTNKVESITLLPTIAFGLLSVLVIMGYVFFLVFQTYTLLLEVILVGLAILGSVFELIMTVLGIVEFNSLETSS